MASLIPVARPSPHSPYLHIIGLVSPHGPVFGRLPGCVWADVAAPVLIMQTLLDMHESGEVRTLEAACIRDDVPLCQAATLGLALVLL